MQLGGQARRGAVGLDLGPTADGKTRISCISEPWVGVCRGAEEELCGYEAGTLLTTNSWYSGNGKIALKPTTWISDLICAVCTIDMYGQYFESSTGKLEN